MKRFYFLGAFAAMLILNSCTNNEPETLDTVKSPAETANQEIVEPYFRTEKDGIILTEAPDSPLFPNAKLSLKNPDLSKNLTQGKNTFGFEVKNFELGSPTPGEEHRECAVSKQGQHIHWILNNAPYTAHYEPTIEKELQPGKHLLLAFLSRSYHESIKNNTAYLLKQINVGATKDQQDYNLNGQHLFYSRPKGEYIGADTEKLLLDFYLVNTNISESGNKVSLTINGTTFLLTKWLPYQIQGLPMGENTVRIQLVDNAGLPVAGPFNDSGDRKIILKPAEQKAGHVH
ncbi:MAG: hypothetical protein H0V01_12540 [Bacteroidetes bacterium]|nr:hypothetical protein [Bacteroidota bacterium]HET6245350.1 hypothetical protein [Bacteroidia bacterium]